MVEPEVAFLEFEGLCELAEDFVVSLVGRALDRCGEELKRLERDTSKLESVQKPFPRITYREGDRTTSRRRASRVKFGDDLGARRGDGALRGARPAADRVPLPGGDQVVLHAARPAGPGGRPRPRHARARRATARSSAAPSASTTSTLLERRLEEHKLPREAYEWYLDVRRYGTFPHSGFGMGLERLVAWICGIHHLREAIPYPRTLKRIYP